jgi:hypothetical protein
MLTIKSKKNILPLYFCVLSTLLFPAVTHAELGGSGSKAAMEAAEQRAAKERKLEKKKLEAEAKKNSGAQQTPPAEVQIPAGGQPEKPAVQ